MDRSSIHILVEGPTDEAVVTRILAHVGYVPGITYGRKGKADLIAKLNKYNQAARFAKWIALVDLDNDAECAAAFVKATLPEPNLGMCFRVAVHEIEAWLLADPENLASFLGIRVAQVPTNPDLLADPKATLIDLARRSHRSAIRLDMVPRPGSGVPVGKAYSSRIQEFVLSSNRPWRVEIAKEHSESLRRCILALQKLRSIDLSVSPDDL